MSAISKILTIGGAVMASTGVAVGGNFLAIDLGSMLFVVGVFRGTRSELQTPVFVGWWK
jgi:hypothetical protein